MEGAFTEHILKACPFTKDQGENEQTHNHKNTFRNVIMTPAEEVTHSLIIRIWFEETAVTDHSNKWRGHITHVPSGQCRYLEKFETITEFTAPYFQINQH